MSERESSEVALVTVYAGPLIEAQRALSALEGHGLRAVLRGEHIGATYGLWGVEVVVRSEEAQAAREILEASGLTREHGGSPQGG